jgi:hypothetical protein
MSRKIFFTTKTKNIQKNTYKLHKATAPLCDSTILTRLRFEEQEQLYLTCFKTLKISQKRPSSSFWQGLDVLLKFRLLPGKTYKTKC